MNAYIAYFKCSPTFLPLAIALVLGLALPGSGQRASESIHIRAQAFQVGMSKAEALSRLALCCKLSGRDDSFFITSKERPFEIYGAIRFAEGKVVWVRRDLNQFQAAESVNFAQALYRQLSDMSAANGHAVNIQTSETEMTNGTSRDITLSFSNGRSIIIKISKVDANLGNMKDFVDLQEYLEKP